MVASGSGRGWDTGASLLRAASVAAGALFVALYVLCALVRLRYPYDLEWVEGGILETVRRAAEGLPVFARPGVDYIPFNYTPLYYYVAAPLLRLLGDGFLPLRLLSFAASLGTMGLVLLIVRRLTGDALAATLAACLFAASFNLTGGWLDLARADSLYVFLLGAGFAWLLLDRSTARAGLASGVLLALAYFTKQSAALAVATFALYSVFARRGAGLIAGGTFVVAVLGCSLWLNVASSGWYGFFTVTVPRNHHVELSRLPYFWMRYVGPLAVATLLGLGHYLFSAGRDPRAHADSAAGLGAMMLSSWGVSMYPGGAHNNAIPGVFAICVLFGLGLHTARRACREVLAPFGPKAEVFLHVACLLQFAALGYDPRHWIPRRADVAAGRSLVQYLAAQPGDVLVPNHNYLATMAGHRAHYHTMALGDVLTSGATSVSEPLGREIQQALQSGRYAAVVLDAGNQRTLEALPNYEPKSPLFTDPEVLMTRSGSPTRAEFVFELAPKGTPR